MNQFHLRNYRHLGKNARAMSARSRKRQMGNRRTSPTTLSRIPLQISYPVSHCRQYGPYPPSETRSTKIPPSGQTAGVKKANPHNSPSSASTEHFQSSTFLSCRSVTFSSIRSKSFKASPTSPSHVDCGVEVHSISTWPRPVPLEILKHPSLPSKAQVSHFGERDTLPKHS